MDGGFGANFRIFSHTSNHLNLVCFLDFKFAPGVTRKSGELQIQHTSDKGGIYGSPDEPVKPAGRLKPANLSD
jgi:hypothetical protein